MAAERPMETGWLPDTPVDDNLLRRFTFSQADINVAFAEAAPSGRSAQDDEIVLSDSGGPIPYYNQALLLRPLFGRDDDVLDRAEAFFDDTGGRPVTLLSVWPTPDLADRGWSLVGHPMLVARGPWGALARSGDGDLVREIGAEEIGEFERVMVEGYPMPEAAGWPEGTAVPPGVLAHGVRLRLGILDGEAVAAAAGHVSHGVVNLCSAATLPAARRKGVWGALVRARMADAPDLPVVAFTSDFSRPGFVHMGFLPVMRFTMWTR